MRLLLPLAAALLLGATPMLAHDGSGPGNDLKGARSAAGIYDRIVAHYGPMGRTVKEKFRDGPCKISRKWERDGDYEEVIKCRGPRD